MCVCACVCVHEFRADVVIYRNAFMKTRTESYQLVFKINVDLQ